MILSESELRSLLEARHSHPHQLLGMHPLGDGSGLVVRAFAPGAGPERALLDDARRGATARAHDRCRLYTVPRTAMEDLLLMRRDLALELGWNLVRILGDLTKMEDCARVVAEAEGADALAAGEALATTRGLLSLAGPFFGPGQDRHLRLAFANVGLEAIAEVPARLRGLA